MADVEPQLIPASLLLSQLDSAGRCGACDAVVVPTLVATGRSRARGGTALSGERRGAAGVTEREFHQWIACPNLERTRLGRILRPHATGFGRPDCAAWLTDAEIAASPLALAAIARGRR